MNSKTISIIVFVSAFLALTACNSEKFPSTGTAEIANPASVFCTEKGGDLKMIQASDGSVAGSCFFSDGSECDEWAYFRAECKPGDSLKKSEAMDSPGSSMQPGGTEEISDWWGVIRSNPPGAQFDDYFERRDLSQTIDYGIDSLDPVIKAKIKELRDSGKVVHLYGTLFSNVPDVNGSQIQVDRIE